jgi:hypothetical protein
MRDEALPTLVSDNTTCFFFFYSPHLLCDFAAPVQYIILFHISSFKLQVPDVYNTNTFQHATHTTAESKTTATTEMIVTQQRQQKDNADEDKDENGHMAACDKAVACNEDGRAAVVFDSDDNYVPLLQYLDLATVLNY